jgi:hypothetical protein
LFWLLPFDVSAELAPTLAMEGEATEQPTPNPFEDMTLIRISSTPSRAGVIIDGQPCGHTPALVEVATGVHEVQIILGWRRVTTEVEARENRTVEVGAAFNVSRRGTATLGLVPWLEGPGRSTRPPQAQRSQAPAPQSAARSDAAVPREIPDEQRSWVRRVPQWPMVEAQLGGGSRWREFTVPIAFDRDPLRRNIASASDAGHAAIGLRTDLFLAARRRDRALRGLGFEFGYLQGAGTEAQIGGETVQDAASYEVDTNIVYRYTWGDERRGATLTSRFGWHRTFYYIGHIDNDLVPPFQYDTLRLDLGLTLPFRTPHLLVAFHGAYLPVLSVGDEAENAYGSEGADVTSHAGELRIELLGRIGGLELSLGWVGRWMSSEFQGVGDGWGDTTRDRVETTDAASDSYHLLRFTLGYRY